MASRKKDLVVRRPAPTQQHENAEFLSQLLAGEIVATSLQIETRGNKRVLAYDDPNG